MKIVVTGSLGHISKPLTVELLLPHHQAEVILGELSETDITFMRPTSFY